MCSALYKLLLFEKSFLSSAGRRLYPFILWQTPNKECMNKSPSSIMQAFIKNATDMRIPVFLSGHTIRFGPLPYAAACRLNIYCLFFNNIIDIFRSLSL